MLLLKKCQYVFLNKSAISSIGKLCIFTTKECLHSSLCLYKHSSFSKIILIFVYIGMTSTATCCVSTILTWTAAGCRTSDTLCTASFGRNDISDGGTDNNNQDSYNNQIRHTNTPFQISLFGSLYYAAFFNVYSPEIFLFVL